MSTEQIDVREYAATRGITTEQAAAELGEQYQGERQQSPIHAPGWPANQPPAVAANLTSPDASSLTQAAKDKLKQVVARVERLEEEKAEVAGQIKDVYAEAKSMGYDAAAIRAMVRERKQDPQERAEREAILDVYRLALDMAD